MFRRKLPTKEDVWNFAELSCLSLVKQGFRLFWKNNANVGRQGRKLPRPLLEFDSMYRRRVDDSVIATPANTRANAMQVNWFVFSSILGTIRPIPARQSEHFGGLLDTYPKTLWRNSYLREPCTALGIILYSRNAYVLCSRTKILENRRQPPGNKYSRELKCPWKSNGKEFSFYAWIKVVGEKWGANVFGILFSPLIIMKNEFCDLP